MGKRDTDLDWTVDDSPVDSAVSPRHARPGKRAVSRPAHATTPRQPSFLRRHRRWLLIAGGALLLLFVAVYAVYWLGWQRVRASLTEQIIYEDTRATASDVQAVLALQATGDEAWLNWRAAQVRLGQASLLPAETFRPLPEPPRLLNLDVRDNGHFEATVLRAFADPSGQSVTFEYRQRFRQLAPGVWESLPADTASLAETSQWAGLHISATYSVADERWMLATLPKLDAYLQTACQDWHCPAGSVVPVVFHNQLPAQPRPGVLPNNYRPLLSLPSLQLSGVPHDEAATLALTRALAARLLEQLAVDLAGANRYVRIPYLDALVARAEVRLKLSPELAEPPRPSDLAAPELLWPRPSGGGLAESDRGPRQRQQALRFLNELLAPYPVSADAKLLHQAGHASSLAHWLNRSLLINGQAAIDEWSESVAGQMAASYPAQWDQLDGLAYTCSSGAWLVRGGRPEQLPIVGQADTWLPRAAVSPDGRWLVTGRLDGALLTILDLASTPPRARQLPAAPGLQVWPLGWMPDGHLALAQNQDVLFFFGVDHQFRLLDPASLETTGLGSLHLLPANWLRQQSVVDGKLAITLVKDAGDPPGPVVHPAALSLSSPLLPLVPADEASLQSLPREQAASDLGFSQSLSPDGRWLAYLPQEPPAFGSPWPPAHVTLFDTLTQQSLQILVSESMSGGTLLHDPSGLTWLPDGSGLVFFVLTGDASTRLMRLTVDLNAPSADVREIPTTMSVAYLAGISGDSRYLALAVPASNPVELQVLDLTTEAVVARAAIAPGARLGGVWSHSGHLLAVQGPAGLYVIDPAGEQQHWIAGGDCQPAWYKL